MKQEIRLEQEKEWKELQSYYLQHLAAEDGNNLPNCM